MTFFSKEFNSSLASLGEVQSLASSFRMWNAMWGTGHRTFKSVRTIRAQVGKKTRQLKTGRVIKHYMYLVWAAFRE